MTSVKRVSSGILVYIGLFLVFTSIYAALYTSQLVHATPSKTCISSISSLLNSLSPKQLEYDMVGSSITSLGNVTVINKWFKLKTCMYNGVYPYIYIDELYPQGVKDRRTVILIHDYMTTHYSLYNLANYLVQKGFHVLMFDLPGVGKNKPPYGSGLIMESIKPKDSLLIHSLCIVKTLVQFAHEVVNASEVDVVGVGLGGSIALMSGELVKGINKTISLGLIGDYPYSLSKASLINYYIRRIPPDKCSDPFRYITNDQHVIRIVVIGSNDEYLYIESLKLLAVKGVIVYLEPNSDHTSFMNNWKTIIDELLIENKSKNYKNTGSIWKLLIPEWPWFISRNKGSNPIMPTVSIVTSGSSNPGLYRVKNVAFTGSWIPLLLAGLVLMLVSFSLEYKNIKSAKYTFLDYFYAGLLFLVLFSPLLPSIWSPGRFNIGVIEYTDRMSYLLPIISQLVLLYIVLEPLLLLKILYHGGRTSFYIYISYPIFITTMVYSFVLIMGYKYGNIFPVYPTTGLIVPLITIVIDYLFTAESPHEEGSSSNTSITE